MASRGQNNLFLTRFRYIEFSMGLSRFSRDRVAYERGLPYALPMKNAIKKWVVTSRSGSPDGKRRMPSLSESELPRGGPIDRKRLGSGIMLRLLVVK